MKLSRVWAMPNKNTFTIKPIKSLIEDLLLSKGLMRKIKVIDPFCNNSPFKDRCISNDIDPSIAADYHMDAHDFFKIFKDNDVDICFFDPPYSPRQVSECYKKLDMTVNMQTTQSSFWGKMKKELGRIIKPAGVVLTCGWNSGGIGKSNGFEIQAVLMVPHGGWHNDTIVTVEQKTIQRIQEA